MQPWAVELSEAVETLLIRTAQSGCAFMSPQEAGWDHVSKVRTAVGAQQDL